MYTFTISQKHLFAYWALTCSNRKDRFFLKKYTPYPKFKAFNFTVIGRVITYIPNV